MSKFKVVFTLKQHTPLIHFQSDQSGATLRATELKPKFDRFLLEQVEEIPFIQNANGSKSLDYKVKINICNFKKEGITYKVNNNKDKIVDEGFPTFFATMGDEWKENPKYFVYGDTIEVEIFSFHRDLLSIIQEYFPQFIFETNFGTRQSKGFGSFSVVKIDNKKYEYQNLDYAYFTVNLNRNIDNKLFSSPNYLQYPSSYYKKQKKLFTIIDIFYKSLRSGINQQGFYFKSLLFMYAKSRNINWDKKYLKQQFINDKEESDLEKNDNVFIVRDLLGLSTNQFWKSYEFNVRHPKKGDKLEGEEIPENEIQRMKSPIMIKPIEIDDNKFKIYLILNTIDNEMLSTSFTLLKTVGKGKSEKIKEKIENFKVWEDFDLDDYFSFLMRFDINNHIEDKSHHFAKLLIGIYQELKANR